MDRNTCNRLIIACLLPWLNNCAGLEKKPHNFTDYNDVRLCSSAKWVYATHDEEFVIKPYLEELEKRDLMPESKFREVFNQKAGLGDRACFLFATWGVPNKNNYTETNSFTTNQYIYRNIIDGSSMYVYMKNGVITAIRSN